MSRRVMATRRATAAGLAAALGSALGLAAVVPPAPALAAPQLRTVSHLRPMYDVGVPRPAAARPLAAALAGTIPNFTKTVTDHGTSFTYAMAGKDPMVKQAVPSTAITTIVVPLVIVLPAGQGTYDPTRGDACDSSSALARTLASPVFAKHAYRFGGTSVGSTQYVDGYQRANFWSFIKPGAINPGYHVLLSKSRVAPQTVNVPLSASATATVRCGKLGLVDINWLESYLRTTLIPRLSALGVSPATFPVFLTENVAEYVGVPGNCCVLGFHSAFNVGARVQTYGIAMYDNTGSFRGSKDISALSHEVAEWMDDPFANNPTKPWGHIGQVSGCQNKLENGDPLSGTVKPVAVAGTTYHVQELAFESWFYHRVPSIGINGWYSNYGKFRTPAAPCL